MRKKAVWIPAVATKRLESQTENLRLYLGKDADLDTFIAQGNEAIHLYEALTQIQAKSRRPTQHNDQLARVARHATALANALDGLNSDPWHLLDERRTRRKRTSNLPNGFELRTLAEDAKLCRMPIRRGAPINGALILLTRDIAAAYETATGRRATTYVYGPFHQALLTVFDLAGIKVRNLAPIYRRALQKN
jgi:hypothetical protein